MTDKTAVERARELLAAKKQRSVRQTKGDAVRRANAKRRLSMARDLSDVGASHDDAAKAMGLTPSGLNTLLYREFGTTSWPIATLRNVGEQ